MGNEMSFVNKSDISNGSGSDNESYLAPRPCSKSQFVIHKPFFKSADKLKFKFMTNPFGFESDSFFLSAINGKKKDGLRVIKQDGMLIFEDVESRLVAVMTLEDSNKCVIHARTASPGAQPSCVLKGNSFYRVAEVRLTGQDNASRRKRLELWSVVMQGDMPLNANSTPRSSQTPGAATPSPRSPSTPVSPGEWKLMYVALTPEEDEQNIMILDTTEDPRCGGPCIMFKKANVDQRKASITPENRPMKISEWFSCKAVCEAEPLMERESEIIFPNGLTGVNYIGSEHVPRKSHCYHFITTAAGVDPMHMFALSALADHLRYDCI